MITKNPRSPKTDMDKRFLQVWNEIVIKHDIKSNRAFLLQNGFPHDLISKITRGDQSVQDNFLSVLDTKFKINKTYIYTGDGKIFQEEEKQVDPVELQWLYSIVFKIQKGDDISSDELRGAYKKLFDFYIDSVEATKQLKQKLEAITERLPPK